MHLSGYIAELTAVIDTYFVLVMAQSSPCLLHIECRFLNRLTLFSTLDSTHDYGKSASGWLSGTNPVHKTCKLGI